MVKILRFTNSGPNRSFLFIIWSENMKVNYYGEIPEGYVNKCTIDAKNVKTAIWFNIVSLGLMILAIAALMYIRQIKFSDFVITFPNTLIAVGIFMIVVVLYMILHELTHGLFYKIFTKKKLKFGLTFSCAFCGVPSIYIKRKPGLVTILAPFVFFSIVFLTLVFFLTDPLYVFLAIMAFSIHFGGCVGDLYLTILLLFKYRGDVIMNDTGPKQTIYVKEI